MPRPSNIRRRPVPSNLPNPIQGEGVVYLIQGFEAPEFPDGLFVIAIYSGGDNGNWEIINATEGGLGEGTLFPLFTGNGTAISESDNILWKHLGLDLASGSIGIYKSEDAGITWNLSLEQIDNGRFANAGIVRSNGRSFFTIIEEGTSYYLLRSFNKGNSWDRIRLLTVDPFIPGPFGLDVRKEQVIVSYPIGELGEFPNLAQVELSTNEGDTWEHVEPIDMPIDVLGSGADDVVTGDAIKLTSTGWYMTYAGDEFGTFEFKSFIGINNSGFHVEIQDPSFSFAFDGPINGNLQHFGNKLFACSLHVDEAIHGSSDSGITWERLNLLRSESNNDFPFEYMDEANGIFYNEIEDSLYAAIFLKSASDVGMILRLKEPFGAREWQDLTPSLATALESKGFEPSLFFAADGISLCRKPIIPISKNVNRPPST